MPPIRWWALIAASYLLQHTQADDGDDLLLPPGLLRGVGGGVSARARALRAPAHQPLIAASADVQRRGAPVGAKADAKDEELNQELLTRLYDDVDVMTRNYRKEVQPVPLCSQVGGCPRMINVSLSAQFTKILGLDLEESTLSIQADIFLLWADHRLAYDSSKYFVSGSWNSTEDAIAIDASRIWQPDLELANAARPMELSSAKAQLFDERRLGKDGFNVKVRQPATLHVKCPFDISAFPWDVQQCEVVLRTWANGDWVRLTNYNWACNNSQVAMLNDTSEEFTVVGFGTRTARYETAEKQLENEVEYTIRLRRHEEFYVMNIILPLHVICFLSIGTLYVPPGTNRISFGATMILTIMSVTFFSARYLPRVGGSTWLSEYEIQAYMIVSVPVFYALFCEMLTRILIRPKLKKTDQDEAIELRVKLRFEIADFCARVIFLTYNLGINMIVVRNKVEKGEHQGETFVLKMYLLFICIFFFGLLIFEAFNLPKLGAEDITEKP